MTGCAGHPGQPADGGRQPGQEVVVPADHDGRWPCARHFGTPSDRLAGLGPAVHHREQAIRQMMPGDLAEQCRASAGVRQWLERRRLACGQGWYSRPEMDR
jgi:hypothetical protein